MRGAIHLWLGLSVGLLAAVMGVAGGILAFYPVIDSVLNP